MGKDLFSASTHEEVSGPMKKCRDSRGSMASEKRAYSGGGRH